MTWDWYLTFVFFMGYISCRTAEVIKDRMASPLRWKCRKVDCGFKYKTNDPALYEKIRVAHQEEHLAAKTRG